MFSLTKALTRMVFYADVSEGQPDDVSRETVDYSIDNAYTLQGDDDNAIDILAINTPHPDGHGVMPVALVTVSRDADRGCWAIKMSIDDEDTLDVQTAITRRFYRKVKPETVARLLIQDVVMNTVGMAFIHARQ